jgi:hypothetical protein
LAIESYSSEINSISGGMGQDTFTVESYSSEINSISGGMGQDTFTYELPLVNILRDTTYGNEGQNTLVAIWESSETKSISGEIWFHPLTDLAIESYSSEINSMSSGIWTNDGERKARGRQLLLTTYASLFFHLSLKFIRGWIPKTKLFSTNLFMTIPAFFLKESNKKEGNEKVDKLNGFYFGSPI